MILVRWYLPSSFPGVQLFRHRFISSRSSSRFLFLSASDRPWVVLSRKWSRYHFQWNIDVQSHHGLNNIMDWIKNWLVVSIPLKNISQLGWLFPVYRKIKNVPNHQPEKSVWDWHSLFSFFLLVLFLLFLLFFLLFSTWVLQKSSNPPRCHKPPSTNKPCQHGWGLEE